MPAFEIVPDDGERGYVVHCEKPGPARRVIAGLLMVEWYHGGFMPDPENAYEQAREMVSTGAVDARDGVRVIPK